MADRRIRIARDKHEIVKRLVASESSTGPFHLIAEALAFAAALGASRGVRTRLDDLSKELEPIRRSVFDGHGFDTLINLLAIHAEGDPLVLASAEEAEDRRATVFEEYANGGLQVLQQELKGAVDLLEALVLLLQAEHKQPEASLTEEFDLGSLIR